ncbi:MAG: phosphoribosyltransferase [Oligoflexales bacterium]
MLFRNRKHAGQELAKLLKEKGYDNNFLVLGLPRGGVPIAHEVATELGASLDIFIVRKLGVPGHEELAMGALGPDRKALLNQELIDRLSISDFQIDGVIAREQRELERRMKSYRKGRPELNLADRDVLLVDDGLATGMSMKVAVEAIRQYSVKSVHVAVPVASDDALALLSAAADGVVCVAAPPHFFGVGQWYDDFSQTSDEEVVELLSRSTHPPEQPRLSS